MNNNKKKIGLMIDLETYGTDNHCVIREISMVAFDPKTFEPLPEFVLDIYPDEKEQLVDGRTTTMETMKWWDGEKQADQKIKEMHAKHTWQNECAALAVTRLIGRLKKDYEVLIIARGATTFDFPILQDYIKQYGNGKELRHAFYNILDLRSFTSILKVFCGKNVVGSKTAHTALSDCSEQIRQIQRASEYVL